MFPPTSAPHQLITRTRRTPLRVASIAAALLLASSLWPASSAALPIDLHAFWDNRCKSCHEESADFARRSLKVEAGRLIGAHHRGNLDQFLGQHGLPADLVAPVQRMLVAQVGNSPIYRKSCAGCHDNAASFARQSLLMKDGVLMGKARGHAVALTLKTHGGLQGADIDAMLATLTRVWGEVQSR